MRSFPLCSIIILNYKGEKVIEGCINSLLKLNYPKGHFEIIVVDNHSNDKSDQILKKLAGEHSNIKLIFLNKNLGFSKGNNIGIKKAKGKFVALINNDSILDKNWLKESVKTLSKDPTTFAVNSKIYLYPKFFNVKFKIDSRLSPLFASLTKSKLYDEMDKKLFYLPLWRKNDFFEIEVPYEPYLDEEVLFSILFISRGSRLSKEINLDQIITFENEQSSSTNKSVKISKVARHEDDIEFQIAIKTTNQYIINKSLNKIQNAGIMVFQDGYGRDIGAIIRHSQQFHEYDLKQYNREREVYAACGAAVLYNKKILDKIGYLDESFFMYYEDVEISERARFAGFKSVYCPKAVVRHHHALFSKEWSPFFIYHVEKGRLLHILYNFPFRVFIKEYYNMVIQSFIIFISILFKFRAFFYKVKKKKDNDEPKFVRRIQTIKALTYFLLYFPFLLFRKYKYDKFRHKDAVKENYLKILKGDWYF